MRDSIYIETTTHFTLMFMESIAFALVAIAFVTAGFFVWYFTFKSKQEERRFLIERGYTLEELAQTQMIFTFPWRKTGIVLVGAVLGMLLHEMTFNIYNGTVPALILGAGIGMILAQALENGYSIARFWRMVLYGVMGFAVAGLTISITVTFADLGGGAEEALAISLMMFCVATALFIERRTRKA
jgi:hypothetical protein